MSTSELPRSRPAKLSTIQLLRALAATMVVAGHILGTVRRHSEMFGPMPPLAFAGGAGVDIFFVISGFIMVHASGRMFGSVAGAKDFAVRRLVRIIPLYWAVTALSIFSSGYGGQSPSLLSIITSFTFVPFDASGVGSGYAFPIVDLGWTLNYEMLFYVVFALLIPLGRIRCVVGAAIVLTLIVTLAAVVPPHSVALRFWSRPIVLEFVLGMAVALAYKRGWFRLNAALRLAAAAAAVGLYLGDPLGAGGRANPVTPDDFIRVVGWGVPSAILLIAAISRPMPLRSRVGRMLVLFGDASYALYLVHPFVISAMLHIASRRMIAAPAAASVFVAATLLAALAAAVMTHKLVERPVTTWLTSRLRAHGAPIKAVPLPGNGSIAARGGADPMA